MRMPTANMNCIRHIYICHSPFILHMRARVVISNIWWLNERTQQKKNNQFHLTTAVRITTTVHTMPYNLYIVAAFCAQLHWYPIPFIHAIVWHVAVYNDIFQIVNIQSQHIHMPAMYAWNKSDDARRHLRTATSILFIICVIFSAYRIHNLIFTFYIDAWNKANFNEHTTKQSCCIWMPGHHSINRYQNYIFGM